MSENRHKRRSSMRTRGFAVSGAQKLFNKLYALGKGKSIFLNQSQAFSGIPKIKKCLKSPGLPTICKSIKFFSLTDPNCS